jgi:hypothetical protein
MYRIIGADGKQYGPITGEQVRQWISEGRANAQTQVFVEGQTEWTTLGQIPEFAAALSAGPPVTPTLTPLPAAGQPKTNPLALIGFILGILSLFGSCCCCYGLPFSIPGVIVSGIALAQLKKDANQQPGKGLAIAGLALSLLGIAIGITVFALGLAANGSDWLRKIQDKYGS